MAFENINVSSLKNALMSCKNSLNHSVSRNLIGEISNSSVWQSDSRNVLKQALEKLNNVRYKELEDKIDIYLNATSYIEEYKALQDEIKRLEVEYARLRPKLYYTDYYDVNFVDENGNNVTETRSRTLKNYSVQNQMFSITNKINNNRNQMEILKNKVDNLV